MKKRIVRAVILCMTMVCALALAACAPKKEEATVTVSDNLVGATYSVIADEMYVGKTATVEFTYAEGYIGIGSLKVFVNGTETAVTETAEGESCDYTVTFTLSKTNEVTFTGELEKLTYEVGLAVDANSLWKSFFVQNDIMQDLKQKLFVSFDNAASYGLESELSLAEFETLCADVKKINVPSVDEFVVSVYTKDYSYGFKLECFELTDDTGTADAQYFVDGSKVGVSTTIKFTANSTVTFKPSCFNTVDITGDDLLTRFYMVWENEMDLELDIAEFVSSDTQPLMMMPRSSLDGDALEIYNNMKVCVNGVEVQTTTDGQNTRFSVSAPYTYKDADGKIVNAFAVQITTDFMEKLEEANLLTSISPSDIDVTASEALTVKDRLLIRGDFALATDTSGDTIAYTFLKTQTISYSMNFVRDAALDFTTVTINDTVITLTGKETSSGDISITKSVLAEIDGVYTTYAINAPASTVIETIAFS